MVDTKGRLFGAALAKVREPPREARSNVHSGRMRSEAGLSQNSRTIMKVGSRLGGTRRVIAVSDTFGSPSSYGLRRHNERRRLATSTTLLTRRPLTSSDDARWSHDKFEGEAAEHPGSEVFIRNLPHSVTKQQLSKLFNGIGEVVSVKIDAGPLTTARVAFVKKNSAVEAVERFHGYKIQGRTIKVSEFQSLDALDADRRKSHEDEDDDINMVETVRYRPSRRVRQQNNSVLMSDAPRGSVFDRLS